MSPQPDNSSAAHSAYAGGETNFTSKERAQLFELAHEAILAVLEGRDVASIPAFSGFSELRGVFTTLYLHGNLRGCVGYAMPTVPLYRAVIETSRGAAFEDPRFPPVSLTEARELVVSLSILSPLKIIQPELIVIGRHGLLITHGGRRGLLLPQVPVEHGWDRTTFLEQTCRKAGLPPDAWKLGAKIEAFTAEILEDQELRETSMKDSMG